MNRHIPNARTIAAMEETEQILADIDAGKIKPFATYDDLLADLEAEILAEKTATV